MPTDDSSNIPGLDVFTSGLALSWLRDHAISLGWYPTGEREDLTALLAFVCTRGSIVLGKRAFYIRFLDESGADLWVAVDPPKTDSYEIAGVTPHFVGRSVVTLSSLGPAGREEDEWYEGRYLVTIGEGDDQIRGALLEAPNFDVTGPLETGTTVRGQVSVCAENVRVYEDEDAFDRDPPIAGRIVPGSEPLLLEKKSFFPVGLLLGAGHKGVPYGHFTGTVVDAELRTNKYSGKEFIWALVQSVGGEYDVVSARARWSSFPAKGQIVSVKSGWMSVIVAGSDEPTAELGPRSRRLR